MNLLTKRIQLNLHREQRETPISPLLFGHFIENMYDCIDPGLYAQVLTSRGFEHPDKNNDGVSEPWYAVGEGEYALDTEKHLAPTYSQRITCSANCIPCGIAQDGLPLHAEQVYSGGVWLYSEYPMTVSAEIYTESGEELYYETWESVPGQWTKKEFEFAARKDEKAKITLLLRSAGTVWFDQASVMPKRAMCTVWPDIMARIRNLHPGIIRFPGGCFADTYHWQDGIGAVDFRPARPNAHWGGTEENGFGTDEFISLCRELECEPMICVNFGSGTPEEAAHWVEYCNGASATEYGALRAQNGHPEPYNVKYWDIGNEVFADWEVGHCNVEEYCARFKSFAQAMRRVDPTIKLVACAGDGNSDDRCWNEAVCTNLEDCCNYLGIHNYTPLTGKPCRDEEKRYYAVAGAPLVYFKRMKETSELLSHCNSKIKLAVTEWNCNYQDGTNQEQTMESAVCNAGMLHAFFRMGEALPIANISDLVNGWPGGIIRSAGGKCYGIPTYHVLSMYAAAQPTTLLKCEYESPLYNADALGNLPAHDGIPTVDIALCKTKDARLCLFAVNRSLEESFELAFSDNYRVNSALVLQGSSQNELNSYENEHIIPREKKVVNDCPVLPPCSVSCIYLS